MFPWLNQIFLVHICCISIPFQCYHVTMKRNRYKTNVYQKDLIQSRAFVLYVLYHCIVFLYYMDIMTLKPVVIRLVLKYIDTCLVCVSADV